jgi:hypothetical protein
VAKKGAICPIFEGDMPPKKNTPKYNAASGIIAGELLKSKKKYDCPFVIKSVYALCCINTHFVIMIMCFFENTK